MIGIVVVTQSEIAAHLIQAAETLLGHQGNVVGINLGQELSLENLTQTVCGGLAEKLAEHPEGMLILTDLFGSTTTNSALLSAGKTEGPIEILTGVNLPMIISSIANRHKLGLKELASKVMSDGQKGIKDAKAFAPQTGH